MKIVAKDLLMNYDRERFFFDTRLNDIRLDFNEYIPHIDNEIFDLILKDITPETFSIYPELKKTYICLSKYLRQPVENILLTSGADQAIFLIFNTFCSVR